MERASAVFSDVNISRCSALTGGVAYIIYSNLTLIGGDIRNTTSLLGTTIFSESSRLNMSNVNFTELIQEQSFFVLHSAAIFHNVSIWYVKSKKKLSITLFRNTWEVYKGLVHQNSIFYCPQGYKGRQVEEKGAVTYFCDPCSGGQSNVNVGPSFIDGYHIPVECQNCTTGIVCYGGMDVVVQNNYWVRNTTTDYMDAYRCPDGYCLQTANDGICTLNREGTLCTDCSTNSTLNIGSFKCSPVTCNSDNLYSIMAIVSFISSLLISIYAHHKLIWAGIHQFIAGDPIATAPKPSQSGAIEILLFGLQALRFTVSYDPIIYAGSSWIQSFSSITLFSNFESLNPIICMTKVW